MLGAACSGEPARDPGGYQAPGPLLVRGAGCLGSEALLLPQGRKATPMGTQTAVAPAARGLAVSGAAARPSSSIRPRRTWVRRTGRAAPLRGNSPTPLV